MRTKPIFFTVMPMIFAGLAIALPLQIAILYGLSPLDFEAIFSKLTPINIGLIGLFGYAAYATRKLSRHLFVALPFINLVVFINNYIVGSLGADFSIFETTLASSAFFALSLTFYNQTIYKIINEPGARWWQSRPRKELSVPITIHTTTDIIQTKSFDISESGVFAIGDGGLELFQAAKGQEIDLSFHLEGQVLKCRGTIVRKALPKGRYPEGVGIHFSQTDCNFDTWVKEQALAA